MGATLTLQFPSDPKFLSLLRGVISAAAKMVGFDETEIGKLQLAVDEAVTNIIRHSLKNDFDRTIDAELILDEQALEVVLRDDGLPVDQDALKPKAPSPDRPGGLGLYLMHECMDKVVYERLADHRNQLWLTKYLKSGQRNSVTV